MALDAHCPTVLRKGCNGFESHVSAPFARNRAVSHARPRAAGGGRGDGHHASRMRTSGVDGPASSGPSRGALGSGLHGPCPPPPPPGQPRVSTQLQRTGSPRPVSVREVCSISTVVLGRSSVNGEGNRTFDRCLAVFNLYEYNT